VASGDRLAFGATIGGFWITGNQGDRWLRQDARLPPVYAVSSPMLPMRFTFRRRDAMTAAT